MPTYKTASLKTHNITKARSTQIDGLMCFFKLRVPVYGFFFYHWTTNHRDTHQRLVHAKQAIGVKLKRKYKQGMKKNQI